MYVSRRVGDEAGRLVRETDVEAVARPWMAPTLLFGAAAIVRFGAAWQTQGIFNDGPSFLRVAAWFHEGHTAMAFGHSYHPLYPLLISWLAPWVGDFALAGVVVSVVFGSLAVIALHAFLVRAFDRRTAFLGGLLFALLPYAAMQSADVQSEGLYFALFLSALAVSWRAVEDAAPGWAAAAGVLAGGAYLVRPEGLGVAAVAVCFAALLLFQGRFGVATFMRVTAALTFGAALVAGPYVLHLHELTGRWMLTQKKSVSDFTSPSSQPFSDPTADPSDQPSAAPPVDRPSGPDRERFRPPTLEAPGARRAGLLPARIDFEPRQVSAAIELTRISVSAMHPLMVLLVFLGVMSVRGSPGDRGRFVLLVLGLYGALLYGLTLGVGYLDRRHVMAPLLPLLGYAGLGLPILGRGLLRVVRPRADLRASGTAAWVAMALVALVTLPKTWAPHREEQLASRRAAEWLASRADLTGAVAADKHRVAWYAGEGFVHLDRTRDGFDALSRAGARYLIVDDAELPRWPVVEAHRATLVELYRVDAAGRTAFVYELAPASPPAD